MDPVVTDEHSLWLQPAPAEARELRTLIETFARRTGTPAFEPHLTLLPGLQGDEQGLIQKFAQLAHERSFPIVIESVQTGSAYHKCLFFTCAPSDSLLTLRRKSETIFSPGAPFFPHISLAYGLDASLCEACRKELERKKVAFSAHIVSLWHAKGLPDEWQCVATHQLI